MTTPRLIAEELIALLKAEDRYAELPEIVKVLQEEAYRNQDISIIAAAPLESATEKELRDTLTKKWGDHPITISVDPQLISGLIIKFQDNVIDMSGKNALQDLKQQLTS